MGLTLSLVAVKVEDFNEAMEVPYDADKVIYDKHTYPFHEHYDLFYSDDAEIAYAGSDGWHMWQQLRKRYAQQLKDKYPSEKDDALCNCWVKVSLEDIVELVKDAFDYYKDQIAQLSLDNLSGLSDWLEDNDTDSIDFIFRILKDVAHIEKELKAGTTILFFHGGY